MTDAELLALHRDIVEIPSISGDEARIREHLESVLAARGAKTFRVGDNLVAVRGRGPVICLNSHLDTVPPCPGWVHPPHRAVVDEGRVHGLGANDAKASVAAMVGAFLRLEHAAELAGVTLLLALTTEEETGGKGAGELVPELRRTGLAPGTVIVGEPTGLDIAVAQKGLLVLELRTAGVACHAAHALALGASNAIRSLARNLIALESVDLGPPDPLLGPVTMEPTVARGGTARNAVPAEASCILDVRINPGTDSAKLIRTLSGAVSGEVHVLSDRLRPVGIERDHPLVQAALRARPASRLMGSSGLSDLVFFEGIPGIKVGPGRTERSHTPDEFVHESEILDGCRFYERAVVEIAQTELYAGETVS
jgi:acetylornithine deacetylase